MHQARSAPSTSLFAQLTKRLLLLRSTILDSGNRALCLKSPVCRIAHGCHVCVAQTTAKWCFATTRTIFACVISALTLTFMQMEMQDDYGHPIFESIKITLVRSARAPTRHLPC